MQPNNAEDLIDDLRQVSRGLAEWAQELLEQEFTVNEIRLMIKSANRYLNP
jgi:hypothetical protein